MLELDLLMIDVKLFQHFSAPPTSLALDPFKPSSLEVIGAIASTGVGARPLTTSGLFAEESGKPASSKAWGGWVSGISIGPVSKDSSKALDTSVSNASSTSSGNSNLWLRIGSSVVGRSAKGWATSSPLANEGASLTLGCPSSRCQSWIRVGRMLASWHPNYIRIPQFFICAAGCIYNIYIKIYILYTQTRIFLIQESVQKRACRESQIPNILYNRFSIVLAFLWFFAGWFWPSTNHMSPLQNLISIRSYSLRKCYLSFSTAPKVKYGWFIFFTGQFVYLQNHNWSRYVNDMVMAMSHSLEHLQIEATSLRQGTYHGILHGASARGQLQRFG